MAWHVQRKNNTHLTNANAQDSMPLSTRMIACTGNLKNSETKHGQRKMNTFKWLLHIFFIIGAVVAFMTVISLYLFFFSHFNLAVYMEKMHWELHASQKLYNFPTNDFCSPIQSIIRLLPRIKVNTLRKQTHQTKKRVKKWANRIPDEPFFQKKEKQLY